VPHSLVGAILSGLKVIDLSDTWTAFSTRLLADVGARVVKVEKPGGDESRRYTPFLNCTVNPQRSLHFWYHNLNKLSVTLDLEREGDRLKLKRLSQGADVLVESFAPGYLDECGLGYRALRVANPGLVYVSVTGFGQSGPYRDYRSCDLVAAAMGGQMSVCGAPDTPPLKPYGQQAYNLASLYTASGIMLALRERGSSGLGQHLDISLQEVVASALDHVLPRFFYNGVVPRRMGDRHWNGAFCILPCRDANLLISPTMEWETLVELLESEGLAGDLKEEKWLNAAYRLENLGYAIEQIGRWTKNHTVAELFEMGQLMRLPWAPVTTIDDVLKSPQLTARDFFKPVAHPEEGTTFDYPGSPVRFGGTQPAVRRAPRLGEHNDRLKAITEVWHKEKTPLPERVRAAGNRDILKGLRVLDFSRILAGPYATRILADFGAEVIKVQSARSASGVEINAGGYFNTWNRNKQSITLDLSRAGARELAGRLVAVSDVVMENFTPRVMTNWGLDYTRLAGIKPDLIMVSLSGTGQDGPWRDFAAFGPTIEALCGITHLTSFTTGRPIGIGFACADHIGGLVGLWAILVALEHRRCTGRGQYIDVSEYEAMCAMLGPALLEAKINGTTLEPVGNDPEYDGLAHYGCYPCWGEDHWCVIAIQSEEEWPRLGEALGNPAGTKEDWFSSAQGRQEHTNELNRMISVWTKRRRSETVMIRLQAAGIAAGMVNDARDLTEDRQLKARDFFCRTKHPELDFVTLDANPLRMSRTPPRFKRVAPGLGQDNQFVFGTLLGLSEAEIAAYVRDGVIA